MLCSAQLRFTELHCTMFGYYYALLRSALLCCALLRLDVTLLCCAQLNFTPLRSARLHFARLCYATFGCNYAWLRSSPLCYAQLSSASFGYYFATLSSGRLSYALLNYASPHYALHISAPLNSAWIYFNSVIEYLP